MVVGLLSNLSNNKYFKIDDSALNNYVDFITIFDVLEFFTKDNIPFIAKYLKDSDELHKLPSYIVNHSQKYDNKLIPKKIKGHKFDAFIDMLFEYDDFLTDYNFDLEEYRYNPKYTDNVLNLDDFLKLNCINKIGLDKKTFNQTLLELSEVHYAYFSFDEQTQLDQAHARIAELEQQLANTPNQATRSQKDELATKSKNAIAKIILALLEMNELDWRNADPYDYTSPNGINNLIFSQLQALDLGLTNRYIGDWIKLAQEQV